MYNNTINTMEDFNQLLEESNKTFLENFKPEVWFGKCIFISWYCDVGTCQFCFRSTQKSRIGFAQRARRSVASILSEALIAKNMGWRVEFLTGGYRIYPLQDLVNIAKLVSQVYGEKVWLNLGALKEEELESFKPYIKGIVSSIETINPELHDKICPNKPIKPYEEMFSYSKDLRKSITIVIGLGEKKEDFELLAEFIEKHKLDRITFYALKPVKGTPYTHGPDSKYYAWWIAKTRVRFPKLQIIAGTTYKRIMCEDDCDTKDEIKLLMLAGANAVTKFPATKKFGSIAAKKIEEGIEKSGRKFTSTLTKMPEVDWDAEVDNLIIGEDVKEKLRPVLKDYLKNMSHGTDDE
ncbi:radical SAM protein [Candidatus Woesearchaeota archaeon]|nr:radical SAM protein [Candidatus Woesearchaeota archaeon]